MFTVTDCVPRFPRQLSLLSWKNIFCPDLSAESLWVLWLVDIFWSVLQIEEAVVQNHLFEQEEFLEKQHTVIYVYWQKLLLLRINIWILRMGTAHFQLTVLSHCFSNYNCKLLVWFLMHFPVTEFVLLSPQMSIDCPWSIYSTLLALTFYVPFRTKHSLLSAGNRWVNFLNLSHDWFTLIITFVCNLYKLWSSSNSGTIRVYS